MVLKARKTPPGPSVSPTLLDAVALWDLDVEGVCVESALLERGHHVVGASYDLPTVGGSLHARVESAPVYNVLDEVAIGAQPARVYVHQGDRAVLQSWGEQDIRAQVARENGA